MRVFARMCGCCAHEKRAGRRDVEEVPATGLRRGSTSRLGLCVCAQWERHGCAACVCGKLPRRRIPAPPHTLRGTAAVAIPADRPASAIAADDTTSSMLFTLASRLADRAAKNSGVTCRRLLNKGCTVGCEFGGREWGPPGPIWTMDGWVQ